MEASAETDFQEMFERARAFYQRPGGDRFLGPELPRWFFVFLLRFCVLLIALKRTHPAVIAMTFAAQREQREQFVADALRIGIDEVD
jgi:hypothetical protein